jgi:NOL1/NOP2/fmu family ribosome biogenesis protein
MDVSFFDFLEERFGLVRADFKGFSFVSDEKRIYVANDKTIHEIADPARVVSYGIVAMRVQRDGRMLKPTTNFFQIFGGKARKNVVELNDEEKEGYIRGFNIEVEPEKMPKEVTKGFVILSWKGHVLGCGYLNKEGIIENQLPKSRTLKIKMDDDSEDEDSLIEDSNEE